MVELTAEMVVDGRLPSDPQVSPDGRHVAFVVAPVGRRGEHAQRAIWLAPADGAGRARRFSGGAANDHLPRWSPDGAWLYFLSDRDERGKAQLHRLRRDGGEAERLTDWKAGLAGYAPLPGGQTVAVWAADPETEEEERRREERDDADVFGEHWQRQRLHLLDLATRELRPLSTTENGLQERHVAEVAPSADGDRLALITWPTPELDNSSYDADLRLLDPRDGEARVVCALPSGGGSPTWSRDGRRLYYLARARAAGVVGLGIFGVDLQEGVPRLLTEQLSA